MTAPKTKQIATLCIEAWEGTEAVVGALVGESGYQPAWRPVRAAAVRALAARDGKDAPWMTTAEFEAWMKRNLRRKNQARDAMGIGSHRLKTIRGGEPITRIEALACAHYGAGLPLPIEPGDSVAFEAWFTPRFGAARVVTLLLRMHVEFITDRIRGYDVNAGQRLARTPDAGLIRALDWIWRVGPFSPYGRRLGGPLFPGQTEEDS